MKLKKQNRKELLLIGVVAIALSLFNYSIERFIDGSLCLVAGLGILFVWKKKQGR